jgi:hypothetical protein
MTEEDAYLEAFRRWGNAAYVQVVLEKDERARWDSLPHQVYQVGTLKRLEHPLDPQWGPLEDWRCFGEGSSWEAAFTDADRGAHRRGGL